MIYKFKNSFGSYTAPLRKWTQWKGRGRMMPLPLGAEAKFETRLRPKGIKETSNEG